MSKAIISALLWMMNKVGYVFEFIFSTCGHWVFDNPRATAFFISTLAMIWILA